MELVLIYLLFFYIKQFNAQHSFLYVLHNMFCLCM